MSYDLIVYASERIDGGQLAAVVESIPGLSLGDGSDGEITVLRGKRAGYSFTVWGPHRIEPEDLPDDVVPHVLDPTTSWQICIEGSSQTEIGSARRFAKALADATSGVAVDEQTDDILGKKKSRAAPARPTAGEPVRELQLHWYSPAGAPTAATLWLQLAKRILPEALPQRFGSYEPFPYRLDRDGEEQFIACYDHSAWFAARLPCLSGGLYSNLYGGLHVDSLNLLAAPLDELGWRNTVRRFFVEYARRRGSVLAVGEVLRNRVVNGPPHPLVDAAGGPLRGYDGILGLPAIPVWWTWLGNDYLRLVGGHLPAEHTTYYPEGALYAPTDEPADRGRLAALPDPIPAGYRVVAIPSDYGPPNAPTNTPAKHRLTIPVLVHRGDGVDGAELRARADAATRWCEAVLATADDLDESQAALRARLDRLAATWTGLAAARFLDGWGRAGPHISEDCSALTAGLRRAGKRLAAYADAYREAAHVAAGTDAAAGRADAPTQHPTDETDLDKAVQLMRHFAVSINEDLEILLRGVDTLRPWDAGFTDVFREMLALTYRARTLGQAVADQEYALRSAHHDQDERPGLNRVFRRGTSTPEHNRYPDTWLDYRRTMTRELAAAGIAEETVWKLVNSRFDYPQAVPIMVDWLQHIDDRVPPGEPRRAMREGLIRNLITKHAKGNRAAVDVLFHQFDIDPPLSQTALQTTTFALAPLLRRQDFSRVAALLRRPSVGVMINDPQWWPPHELVQWLGRVKNNREATELAVAQLENPRNRIAAMRALAQQRAHGVRALVARHLDDENEAVRSEAAKALAKLPVD